VAAISKVDEWIAANARVGSAGATDAELDAAGADLDIQLPSDYRAMMRRVNGGESEFGDSRVRLWPAGDLAEHNAGYQVREFAPGFTYFGSNGGGEAYAWDWRPTRKALYVVIPFIVPEPDAAIPCGDSLEEFLATLHRGIPFEGNRQ
jgi:hypothetical protein